MSVVVVIKGAGAVTGTNGGYSGKLVAYRDSVAVKDTSYEGSVVGTTHQAMGLLSILAGLRHLKMEGQTLTLVVEDQHVANLLDGTWKSKANKHLVQEIRDILIKHTVKIVVDGQGDMRQLAYNARDCARNAV